MKEASYITYYDKEFLHRNVHYEPGWYFPDEEGDLYGPFLTKTQTEMALRMYLQQLMDGVAPTQINQAKLLEQRDEVQKNLNAHEED